MLSSEITKIVFDQLIRLKRNNEISLENIINFHESENNDNNILSIIS
jgi:hypothetical protein